MLAADLDRFGAESFMTDGRRAGQAVRRGFTLVTANVREFERVDDLMWEDWSVASA